MFVVHCCVGIRLFVVNFVVIHLFVARLVYLCLLYGWGCLLVCRRCSLGLFAQWDCLLFVVCSLGLFTVLILLFVIFALCVGLLAVHVFICL